MGETVTQEKQSIIRTWIERHIGKVIMASLPIMMAALATWIVKIEGDLASVKTKLADDKGQWNALLSMDKKLKSLEIDSKVNQKLMYLMTEKEIDPELLHLERLMQESEAPSTPDEDDADEASGDSGEEAPRPTAIKKTPRIKVPIILQRPRSERLEEFRQENMDRVQNMAQQKR